MAFDAVDDGQVLEASKADLEVDRATDTSAGHHLGSLERSSLDSGAVRCLDMPSSAGRTRGDDGRRRHGEDGSSLLTRDPPVCGQAAQCASQAMPSPSRSLPLLASYRAVLLTKFVTA